MVNYIITLAASVLLSPVILVVAILVRLKIGSPILFKQVRSGLNGKPFVMYKFRTMKNIYDSHGDLLPDVDRMTSFGSFLRRYSLDELPELYNVLKGDMNLVGPRPLLMEYLPLYSKEQVRRHEVKPGVTGWAQVNGRNAISWEEKFKLDVWYVDNRSFWLDLKILFLTFFKMLSGFGVDTKSGTTMPFFTGKEKEKNEIS